MFGVCKCFIWWR